MISGIASRPLPPAGAGSTEADPRSRLGTTRSCLAGSATIGHRCPGTIARGVRAPRH